MRQITPQDMISVLRRWWPLALALSIVGAGAGYAAVHYLPKRYVSQTTVLVQQQTVPGDYVKPVVDDDALGQRLASMQQEILSRTSLVTVISQFGLYRSDSDHISMDDLVSRLQKAITVTPMDSIQGTSKVLPGFNVSVTFDDPHLAQSICSTVTSRFIEADLRDIQGQSQQTTDFLSGQLDTAKAKLDDQDAKLAAFKRQYLGALPDEEQTNLNLLTGVSTQLESNTEALSRAQQDKTFAESRLQEQLAAVQSTPDGQSPQALQQQLTTLQGQLTELLSKYTDNHPDVVKTKSAIEALQKKIADTDNTQKIADAAKPAKPAVESAEIQSLRAQIHEYDQVIHDRTVQQEQLQQQIKLYQDRVQMTPTVEQEYKELNRGYQTALDDYNDLLKNRNQAAMATDLERRQEGQHFYILDPANLPEAPSSPKKPLFVGGGFGAGLALGFGVGLLFELLDTSLRNEKEVEALLQIPVLVMVPALHPATAKKAAASAATTGSMFKGALGT